MARKGSRSKPRRSRARSTSKPRRTARRGSIWSSLLPKLGLVAVGVAGGAVIENLVAPTSHMGKAIVCGGGAAATVAIISLPFKSLRKTSALVPTMAFAGAAGAVYGARGWLAEKTGKLTFRIRNGRWPGQSERIIDTTLVDTSGIGQGIGPGYGTGIGTGVTGVIPNQLAGGQSQQTVAPPAGVTNITYAAPEDKSTSFERILLGITGAAAEFGGAVLGGSKGGSVNEIDALAYAVA